MIDIRGTLKLASAITGVRKLDELDDAFEELEEREKGILRMRFGLDCGITHNLEEVGKEFGVTRERIRQIEAKALEKLRGYFKELN